MNRAFPSSPVCAVGAIVFRQTSVLLVQRARPPGEGKWSIPGGAVHLGETLEEALVRELLEEAHVEVRPVRVSKVLDRIFRDSAGIISYHYVIVDYLCEIVRGEPKPGSDARDAGFFEVSQLDSLDMTEGTANVIREVYKDR
jgi:8-oxo-dGTP diphosphatase